MPRYQIDSATLELINALLDADILQLILIAPILVVLGQMFTNVLAFIRERRRQREADTRRERQDEADDKVILRLISIADRQAENSERANDNTAALTAAIVSLDQTQQRAERERMEIHTANRESILAGNEGIRALNESIATLATSMNTLQNSMKHWHALVNDTVAGLRSELVQLMSQVAAIQDTEQKILNQLEDPALRKRIENVIGESNRQIIGRLDDLLNRLPPPTPPPTEPDDQPGAGKSNRQPLDLDAAKHDATVDLPKTGTEG